MGAEELTYGAPAPHSLFLVEPCFVDASQACAQRLWLREVGDFKCGGLAVVPFPIIFFPSAAVKKSATQQAYACTHIPQVNVGPKQAALEHIRRVCQPIEWIAGCTVHTFFTLTA